MKTFFEYFLDEVQRRLDEEEIDEERARTWIEEMRKKIKAAAEKNPHHPLAQMPVGH